jgi:hypothetical protein
LTSVAGGMVEATQRRSRTTPSFKDGSGSRGRPECLARRPDAWAPTNQRKQRRLDVSPSLQRVELGVEASGGDQLVVGSLLNNPTALEHHDVVGHAYRGEPMRDE